MIKKFKTEVAVCHRFHQCNNCARSGKNLPMYRSGLFTYYIMLKFEFLLPPLSSHPPPPPFQSVFNKKTTCENKRPK